MRYLLILFGCFLSYANLYGQTNEEKASKIALQAITLMDQGKVTESLSLLEEASSLDPKNPDFYYEIANGYFRLNQFNEALGILNILIKKAKPIDRYYQLTGKCLTQLNKTDSAQIILEEGLNKFPNSTYLLMELGLQNFYQGKYNSAIVYFEHGIKADPTYSSNYYWASIMYLNSANPIWGILYGEEFMNLERGSKRTEEISKLLFEKYKSEILFNPDSSVKKVFSISKNNNIEDLLKSDLPYENSIIEPLLYKSCYGENQISISSLYRILKKFNQSYSKINADSKFNNHIFQYHQELINIGYFESYIYWLFLKGDEVEFKKWFDSNKSKWNQFLDFYQTNPMKINKVNFLLKSQINK